MMQIRAAHVADYMEWFGQDLPSWVVIEDGERVGLAGIFLNIIDSKHWGYFDLKHRERMSTRSGIALVNSIRKGLKDVEVDVYVLCQKKDFATAPRFLSAIGFAPTGELIEGEEVWVCPGTTGE